MATAAAPVAVVATMCKTDNSFCFYFTENQVIEITWDPVIAVAQFARSNSQNSQISLMKL